MIEDIKREIKRICMVYLITPCPDCMKADIRTEEEVRADVATTLKLLDKVLDKYKDIDKYKNAWEELKDLYTITYKDTMSKNDYRHLYEIEQIEQKHNIRKEDLDE